MKKRIAMLLAVLLLLALVPAAHAEAADSAGVHEHRWVASAITRIRTCRLCGEQLRDIADEKPIVYSVPTNWTRYQVSTGSSSLWFPHGHADYGTVSIYRTKLKGSRKIELEALAKERVGKGQVISSEKTKVAGREAFLVEYRSGDEVGCVISFYDSASRYGVDWKVSSNERSYAMLRETVEGLLETLRFTGDPEPEIEQNREIPSGDLAIVKEAVCRSNSNYPKPIAVLRNDSGTTADLCAVFEGVSAAGKVVDTKSAFAYSVAPGEEVVVSQTFNSKSRTFRTKLYGEPSVYYEAMGDNQDLKVTLTAKGSREILISAENRTQFSAVSITATLLYYNGGELVELDTQILASGDSPLAPGKTASTSSFCFEDYDDMQCYISAFGEPSGGDVAQEPGQVELLAEYVLEKDGLTDRFLILKNNGDYPCMVNTSTTAIGAGGEVLDSAINYGVVIAPGATEASFEYFHASDVDHFDTRMKVGDAFHWNLLSPENFRITSRNRNTISGTRVQGELTVTATNLGRETAGGAGVRALFFKSDKLVAWEDADLADDDHPMAPGKTATVKISPDAEYDRYEIYFSARAPYKS